MIGLPALLEVDFIYEDWILTRVYEGSVCNRYNFRRLSITFFLSIYRLTP